MKSRSKKSPSTDICWYILNVMLDNAERCSNPPFFKWYSASGGSLTVAPGACANHYNLICAGCDERAMQHCPQCGASVCPQCVHSETGHNPPGQQHVFTGLQLLTDADLDTRISNIGKDAADGSNSPQD